MRSPPYLYKWCASDFLEQNQNVYNMLYRVKIVIFEVDKFKLSSRIIDLGIFYIPDERTIPNFSIILTKIINSILHKKI